MATVTSEPPMPLVRRLQSLCQHIDKNVALLKLDISRPSGSTPFTYDRGLNAIESDISELKIKCKELKGEMESINNFSNWLHSMQDLVDQQTEDIKKVEKYLTKFGYTPIPNPATEIPITSAPKVEMDEEVPMSENKTAERTMQDSSNSKENMVTKSHIYKLPEVPIVTATSSKQVNNSHKMDTTQFQKTPLSSRTKGNYFNLKQSAGRGSCYKHGHSTIVEEWLKGIENCNLELTPDVLRPGRAPLKQKQRDRTEGIPMKIELPDMQIKPEISEENVSIMKMHETPTQNSLNIADYDRYSKTPRTPELSEFTMQFLNLKKFQAEKENTAPPDQSNTYSSQNGKVGGSLGFEENCNQGKSINSSQFNMKNCTLEEPIMSCQALATATSHMETKTLEEPMLPTVTSDLFQSRQVDLGTHKKPVLSYHHSKYSATSEFDSKTPEEPILSCQDITSTCTISGTTTTVDCITPEEPVLSSLNFETTTIEEPVLSNQITHNKYVNPVLSHASSIHTSKNVQSHLMYDGDDMPKSPQLSEITLSLLSATDQGYSKCKSLNTKTNLKQESLKTNSRDDVDNFGRNVRDASHRAQPSQLFDKAYKEKISLPADVSSQDRQTWHRPGIPLEKFVGGADDDIPHSPQLSETTQRLLARFL